MQRNPSLDELWQRVQQAHARTTAYRAADDPDTRRALAQWAPVYIASDPANQRGTATVLPFRRRAPA